jgi:hypothetical protein
MPIFPKRIQYGHQKAQNLMLISNQLGKKYLEKKSSTQQSKNYMAFDLLVRVLCGKFSTLQLLFGKIAYPYCIFENKKFLSLRAFLQTLIPKVKNAFNTCVYESISHQSPGLSIRFLKKVQIIVP